MTIVKNQENNKTFHHKDEAFNIITVRQRVK